MFFPLSCISLIFTVFPFVVFIVAPVCSVPCIISVPAISGLLCLNMWFFSIFILNGFGRFVSFFSCCSFSFCFFHFL